MSKSSELENLPTQPAGYGAFLLENLARDLQAEFPGRNGFSAPNLWLMRQFFNEYSKKPKLQPLVAEISWAKNLVILARCKDDLEREFYLRATARFGWTKNVLQHQLDNHSYAPCPARWVSRPTLSLRSSPSATRTTCPAQSRSPRGCKAGWAVTTTMKAQKLRY